MEIFKIIDDFPMYEVSNYGNIRNKKSNRLLKLNSKNGYVIVKLYNKSVKNFPQKVHRLVANAFISNPNKLPVVNHINEIKFDNRIENLQWVSYKENSIHSIKPRITKKRIINIYNNSNCTYASDFLTLLLDKL